MIKTVGSFYAGIGGFDLAASQVGLEVAFANEYDSFACETYRANLDHNLIEGDVLTLDFSALPSVDLLTAGFPCQPFSIGGYQKGFDDSRGNHFFRMLDYIDMHSPKVVLFENVSNIRTHDNGKTFRVIRDCMIDRGYTLFDTVLNTLVHGGLPQHRERWFCACVKDYHRFEGLQFPLPIPLDKSPDDILLDTVDESEYLTDKNREYRYFHDNKLPAVENWFYRYQYGNMTYLPHSPTLIVHTGSCPMIYQNGLRWMQPVEMFRLQGWDHIELPVSDTQAKKQAGNSVTVSVVRRMIEAILHFYETKVMS